jgi:hypothetical protein
MIAYLILFGAAMIAAGALANSDIYINTGIVVITIAGAAATILREIRKGRG